RFLTTVPRPPTSPPFPYTTLFRSGASRPRRASRNAPGSSGRRRVVADAAGVDHRDDERPQRGQCRRDDRVVDVEGLERPADGIEDRKSTRLNSSHLVISYAVFCLK